MAPEFSAAARREVRENTLLRKTFSLHVGSKAAECILAHDPRQGGTEQVLTVMFCDIRDFTPRCARQTPDAMVRLLNAFYGVMVRIVEDLHGGMINQMTGDGFLALFGAYGGATHHSDAALKAGREMLRALKGFNVRLVRSGFEPLAIGIGIHTGPAMVGTVGSPRRKTFTAIGHTVNLAARVEAQTKSLGQPLLVTKATRDALAEEVHLVEMPAQQMRGVGHPVRLYAPPNA
jgi:adenylate cyclase